MGSLRTSRLVVPVAVVTLAVVTANLFALPATATASSAHTAPAPSPSAQALGLSLPAPPVQPEPCPPPPIPPLPPPAPLGPPVVREAAVPVAGPPPPRHVALAPVTGKGMWLTVWPSSPLNVDRVITTARSAGLHQLWLRTGSTQNGFYGGPLLKQLVPAAHKAGISVIAWDFPTLSDPAADAARAALAFHMGADAFSPDIESPAEGTYLTARRVRYYLSLVRAAAKDRPVIATVPRPDSYWLTVYPYGAEAPFVDAFAPMVYWSCTEPGAAVSEAITILSRWRPVAPIGQDFNMGPIGGPPGLPSPREIWRFLDVARRLGAVGASLFDLEEGGPQQLRALAYYPW